ncbi:LOW QUALITY PROTEIN: bucky ball [Colossoma macropomum]|uniref:LOW QUALITY PROTEIN: bucky ball n=1 Tax=Colossoma macropomum TaxID=42526 RepID=UPI001864332F|nr:LOW QUALITY PROTEIN: bucky ball [Colossoma macropomum]
MHVLSSILEVNSTSQSTDVEQPHHPVNHSRPFFYVQPPSQPYFMYQWPMDPFGQYGFPGPVFPLGRPFMAPYQYMQYPGYVVPHAPMQPTDYRRVTPLFPSVASYDLRFRQHFQQMSVHRDTTSSEAQTEPGDPVSKLADSLDGLQDNEKSGAVKESNVMLSSTPAIICYTQEVEKLNYGDAKPASELAKAEQDEEVKPVTFCDSAVYDAESSPGRLEECALSGVLPLDSSSIHEEGQGMDDQLRDTEMACLQSVKSDGNDSDVLGNMKSLNLAEGQDSGACVSEISEKTYPFEVKASDQGKQAGNLSPKSVEVVEPPVQTAMDNDLPYQILRLPCNKTTTGLVLQKEVNPLVYLDTATPPLPPKRHSLGNAYPYSYYPQVAQERQSVLSPSLDELSSRDEMFSTDMEDELMAGQVYIGGGKLAETSAVPTRSDEEHRDDACSVCAKTCACCGASLPDEDETILAERFSYLEKDVAQELSDQDCECELEERGQVPGTCESQTLVLRQQASRPALPPCGRQTAKHKTRKVQEGAELSEQDQGHGRGECGELLHPPAKADRVKGKGQKGGQSRSFSEHQCREGRQGDVLDQESWTSCSGKQKSRSHRPANGLQEKGRPGRRRSYCKMFAQQRPKRNEYDDNDEAEFSHYQRGRGSMKRRGTRY